VRYDNLKPAVTRILKGRDRDEAERFVALRSHYGFESFFCQPGLKGAHEKGGVEAEIGRFRRRHLVPVPKSTTLADVNEHIAAADLAEDTRVITGRPITIGAAFAAERTMLMALPAEAFDPARLLLARVDKRARISVRQRYYSVPARYVARRLSVRLSARTVEVFDGPKRVATHERAFGRYVEVLARRFALKILARVTVTKSDLHEPFVEHGTAGPWSIGYATTGGDKVSNAYLQRAATTPHARVRCSDPALGPGLGSGHPRQHPACPNL
jgi:hypothetical protein